MNQTVLFFFDYATSFGGAVNTLLQQMLLIRDVGYDVYGFVSGCRKNLIDRDYVRIFKAVGVELRQLDYTLCSHTEDIDIVDTLECYEEVKKIVQKYHPVLLHSVQINSVVELVGRKLGIPHIMDIYQADSDFFAISYTNIFPQYHICDSECFARVWQKGLGIQSFCVRTLAERCEGKENVNDRKEFRYICVGQITGRKNQLNVIKGFHKALAMGVKGTLKLYGRDLGPYANECRQYIIEHKLEKYIAICGFCSDKAEIYADADVLICGSCLESYPNVISEALANHVVVVSTPVAGVPEVIKDKGNGYLCAGYAVDDITTKIVEAYCAFLDGSIQDILQRADKTFLDIHSSEQVMKELRKIYELVERNGVPLGLPQIGEIREKFEKILKLYYLNEERFSKPEFVRKKLWYLYHVNPLIHELSKKGRNIYIWGAGKIGACLLEINEYLECGWKVEGFLDEKRSEAYMGYPVYKPEEIIADKKSVILIAFLNGTNEAMEQLKSVGREYTEDYFLMVPRQW